MADNLGSFNILLVEDNAGDVFMVREALDEAGFSHVLNVVNDGYAAMELLHEESGTGRPRLDLIILDLNLPGISGRQVMSEIQSHPSMRVLPVAILTTSRSEAGIVAEFPQLRSTFAAKTPDFRRLVEIIHRFRDFAQNRPV
jgi:CheY-like chemotaxis protein